MRKKKWERKDEKREDGKRKTEKDDEKRKIGKRIIGNNKKQFKTTESSRR
jgi:hypothetical protein